MSNITEEERKAQIQSRKDFKATISKKEAERRAAAELFSVDEFIADASMMREVYVEAIDRRVPYKKLTLAENSEIARIKDDEERGLKMLYMVLNKADPTITEESLLKMSAGVASAIMTTIVDAERFLRDSDKKT